MKVAVSSTGTDLSAKIDPRFGRCAYFVIVDTDDMSVKAFPNDGAGLSGGAGVQAAAAVLLLGLGGMIGWTLDKKFNAGADEPALAQAYDAGMYIIDTT